MAAFLMAVQFSGMEPDELSEFVRLMLHSGATLDLSDLGPVRVDKHSTGGVGDKVSLALAPLVAEAGVLVPMMSGRGLGHTGGTLDKLESIPGLRTDLSLSRFRELLERLGTAMIGQTDEIAPLDRRLYALRSVTATVPSIPLIASSIMSKKLAEDLTGLVLDVKVGSGAFLADEKRSLELARTMVGIGRDHGVRTVAVLTAMDRPLGRSAGNALEVVEAIACLRGEGPDDLREIVLALAAEMIAAAHTGEENRGGDAIDRPRSTDDPGSTDDPPTTDDPPPAADLPADRIATARDDAERLLDSGAPLERFRALVEAQGGDPGVVDDPERLPRAPVVRDITVERAGRLRRIEPRRVGDAVVELGGGRTRLGAGIHPGVGFDHLAVPGTELTSGDRIARVHARSEDEAERAIARIREAAEFEGDSGAPLSPLRPLRSHRVTENGVQPLSR